MTKKGVFQIGDLVTGTGEAGAVGWHGVVKSVEDAPNLPTGMLGKRNGDWFKGFDGYRCNADWNASQNIGQWVGFSCPLSLQSVVSAMGTADAEGAVNDSPLTGEASKRVDLSPA